ncbi:MAG: hydrogenase expression/formation protein HypE [Coriobacteriales bacterium]|jgi:hydrogenase expression/formation protein HypE|nr:hydrogenase expression/formation protein HypE [Coriobacteriales bacterium]
MTKTITMAHGSGGSATRELIQKVFMRSYATMPLLEGNDSAVLPMPASVDAGRLAITTDSFVVTPQFFPGGDIGRLAVCGTVNDLACAGASPHYLSAAFILEEGYSQDDLITICLSMARASEEAGILIVTGDTKVVERGHGDGVYINTTGVGFLAPDVELSGAACRPGDAILLSGTLGDHGIAIVSVREGLSFETDIRSDAAPLYALCEAVLKAAPGTHAFRDPTRGGLASTLSELAEQSRVAMLVEEQAVPVRDEVRGACDLLGYDVFQVANEGKMVAIVPAEQAEAALAAMRSAPYGADAAIIGEVQALATSSEKPQAYLRTPLGSRRVMDVLSGEQLPRIC